MIGGTRIGRHRYAVCSVTVVAALCGAGLFPAFAQGPAVTSFAINSGAAAANGIAVTLNNTATNSPSDYMASESASFSGAAWLSYSTAPSFSLSIGVGPRTVYFKVKNGAGESGVVSDTIFLAPEMLPVAAGTFMMGNSGVGDDATATGTTYEFPVHAVTLSAYEVAKFTMTNKQYCDVFNWALAQHYVKDPNGDPWTGTGNYICGGGNLQNLVEIGRPECNIQYVDGAFSCKSRIGVGTPVPDPTNYPMDTHPVVTVSWYGSVAFCNWLSEWQGLTPCYDMTTVDWPLMTPPPTSGGYRLPTEAEWERAAAWDGSKHWIYGFTSDTLTGNDRCNFCPNYPTGPYVNPLGIVEDRSRTSPAGWFNGINISPNGNVPTVNSVSPVGAYDMSGNIWEWCTDRYWTEYYSHSPTANPTGPDDELYSNRVMRGGSFRDPAQNCRTATRDSRAPTVTPWWRSFRIARTPYPVLVITEQPVDGSAYVGGSHTFSIVVTGGFEPLAYQWRKDGGDVTGGTNSSYTISPVVLEDAVDYACTVTDENNKTVVSNTVHLTVIPGALPVAGPAILALLAVSFVLAGRRSLRQRK